jgi:hypothetical protein
MVTGVWCRVLVAHQVVGGPYILVFLIGKCIGILLLVVGGLAAVVLGIQLAKVACPAG